jgi:hypothetical protein
MLQVMALTIEVQVVESGTRFWLSQAHIRSVRWCPHRLEYALLGCDFVRELQVSFQLPANNTFVDSGRFREPEAVFGTYEYLYLYLSLACHLPYKLSLFTHLGSSTGDIN